MKDGTKVIVGLTGIAAALGIAKLVSGEAPLPVPENGGAGVEIIFTPVKMSGRRVAYSPKGRAMRHVAYGPTEPVLEGRQTALTVIVKNASTQGGVAVAATLTTSIGVKTTDGTIILPPSGGVAAYSANGTKTYSYTITAPLGKGGQNLLATAVVLSPDNATLATGSASEPIAEMKATILDPLITWVALGYWQLLTFAHPVPYGEDVKIGFDWQNNSAAEIIPPPTNCVGHAALQVMYPDGSLVYPTAYAGQDLPAPKDWINTGVRFNSFKASQSGGYQLTLTLSCQGRVIAEKITTIMVTVPPIIYGATVTIG